MRASDRAAAKPLDLIFQRGALGQRLAIVSRAVGVTTSRTRPRSELRYCSSFTALFLLLLLLCRCVQSIRPAALFDGRPPDFANTHGAAEDVQARQ